MIAICFVPIAGANPFLAPSVTVFQVIVELEPGDVRAADDDDDLPAMRHVDRKPGPAWGIRG